MIIDSNVLIGNWPFRRLPYTDPGELRKVLSDEGITRAIAGSLNAVFFRDVQDGNEMLYKAVDRHRDFFTPAATINPTYALWEKDYKQAIEEGAAALRIYPEYQNWDILDHSAFELYEACRKDKLPIILTAEIEDIRQRHFMDNPRDWLGGEVRQLIEHIDGLKILVVNARADRMREIALTLPSQKRKQVFFDISAVWGPFVDDIALCVNQIGAAQFVFGSHASLKTPETAVMKLKISQITEQDKKQIFTENIKQIMPRLVSCHA